MKENKKDIRLSENGQDLISEAGVAVNEVTAEKTEVESNQEETAELTENFSEEELEENAEITVAENGFDNCTVADLYALNEQFPDENVAQDIISEPFRIFSKGKIGKPGEIYSEYLDFRRSFEKGLSERIPARGLSGQEKNTRAYSGFDGAGIHRNASAGLTKRQMQIARESGMSFREYAELLDSVPHGRNL